MTLEELQSYVRDKNIVAFLRVIRAGESSQEDSAYTLINGGGHFSDLSVHPYDGIPTTQGARACGAYQFLGTTWKAIREQYGISDFSPVSQDLGCIGDIANHGALAAIQAGELRTAIQKLAKEWVSLPILYANGQAAKIFAEYGGTVAPESTPAPEPTETPTTAATAPQGSPMPLLALLPLIAQFVPQIMTLIKPGSQSTAKDAAVAGTILNTVVQAAGIVAPDGTPAQANAATVGQAAEKMAADPDLAKTVQQAVVTHPDILPLLEVGGGVAAARQYDVQTAAATQPFWKASPVFWISIIMLPIVYWLVGSLIVGGMLEALTKANVEIPNWMKLVLALFGGGWNGESRSGGFNLVIGLILGGICGVYYGVSVTQQKQQAGATQTADTGHPES